MKITDPEDICDCWSLPVMWWHVPGHDWFVGSIAWDGPSKMVKKVARLDRKRADAYGVTEFRCVCPQCGIIFIEGNLE
jgi:hypothetical protein